MTCASASSRLLGECEFRLHRLRSVSRIVAVRPARSRGASSSSSPARRSSATMLATRRRRRARARCRRRAARRRRAAPAPPPGRSSETTSASSSRRRAVIARGRGRRSSGAGAWAAIASVSSSASSRRSIGQWARAASIPTTRPSTGPTSGPDCDRQRRVVASGAGGAQSRSRGDRCVGEPEDHPDLGLAVVAVPSSSDSASVAISGRPSPSPGLSGRGMIPRPASTTTTVTSSPSTLARDLHRTLAVGVGVDDDVRARLGDRELDVRQRLIGHVRGVAEPAEGMPNDRHVLSAGRAR